MSQDPGAQSLRSLKVGILCDDLRLARWQAECIAQARAVPGVTIALLIINKGHVAPPGLGQRLRALVRSGLFLWRIYERLCLNGKLTALEPVDCETTLADVERIECIPQVVGKYRQALAEADLDQIRSGKLDVLLRFGFGILTGPILDAASLGVWSFHHGDPAKYRGAPPGFWEIHNGEPVTGVILQRLTERLDGGTPLCAGHFKTNAANYARSLDRILSGASFFFARALSDVLHNGPAVALAPPHKTDSPVYRNPRNGAMLRFAARAAIAKIKDQAGSLFRHQQWNVGIIPAPLSTVFGLDAPAPGTHPPARWLREEKGYFLADPFSLAGTGTKTVSLLAERLSWKDGLGRIASIEASSDLQSASHRTVIERPEHLSYPFVLHEAGETYCVPECSQSGGVTLYRLDPDSGEWAATRRLIADFPAVDPTIVRHNDRWWLFCTSEEHGPNEMLFAWHSPALDGPWEPHRAVPLKVDIRSSRPAGPMFVHDGELYRPAQDCSENYGGAITLNRIVRLDEYGFEEEPVGRLVPDEHGPYPAGLHTVQEIGGRTLIDGARWTFVGAQFSRALAAKLHRFKGSARA